jgi:ABC-type microcin C transport system permease subunit YejE
MQRSTKKIILRLILSKKITDAISCLPARMAGRVTAKSVASYWHFQIQNKRIRGTVV